MDINVIPGTILLSVLLSVFRFCATSPLGSTCADVHLSCTNKPFHDALNDDGFSLLREETLAEHCSDILEDLECKRNYLSSCEPSGLEAFTLATDGIKDVLIDLCNETSDIRKAFHTHSPCLASSTELYEECVLNTMDDTGNVDEYDEDGNDITSNDDTIKKMCRFYGPFKHCVTQATRTLCGDSAAHLVEQIVVRTARPAVSQKCPSTGR